MSNLSLERLTLRNFRCFEDLSVSFHPRITVLVAPNGGGKSAILDGAAVALGPYVGAFDEAKGRDFSPSDIRRARMRETAGNEMEFAPDGASLEASGTVPAPSRQHPEHAVWRRSLANPIKAKTTVKDAKILVDAGKELQRAVRSPQLDHFVTLPVVAYYGTGRLWKTGKSPIGKLARTSRTVAYSDCFEAGVSFGVFAKWFGYWQQNAFRGEVAREDGTPYENEFDLSIQSVVNAVDRCLEITGWGGLSYDLGRQELVARHQRHGTLPVSSLSDGIRNMVGMVADIAFRSAKLNPHLNPTAGAETPGVVLIDEIDLHLHPEWQQVVAASLMDAFPEIQFIVTTHSPQVLTTVHRDSIRVLSWKNGAVEALSPAHETYAQESRAALEDVMGVQSRPPTETNRRLLQYLSRVEDGHDSAELNSLRVELEKELGAGDPQLQLADMLIARSLAKRSRPKP